MYGFEEFEEFNVPCSAFRVLRLNDLKMSKQLFLQNTEHGTL